MARHGRKSHGGSGYGGSKTSTGKSGGSHSFAQVPKAEIQRSVFDRSHGLKTAFNSADLIPIFVDEALPGDTLKLRMASFVRMTTPIFPVMDNMFMDVFFFAVPYRLVWDNWHKFMGEQETPGDSTDFLVPTRSEALTQEETLSDYLGIPVGVNDLEFNCLWHRAYNLIWSEWFRDENLQDPPVLNTHDGPDGGVSIYPIRKRGKRHDYFTGSLPFPQKGDAVELSFGGFAPVLPTGDSIPLFEVDGAPRSLGSVTGGGFEALASWNPNPSGPADLTAEWSDTKLTADLSQATANTINEIREAFQVQRLLERDARGGTRYTEIVRSHFGVTSPDQRLQRPEYLGGGSTRINVNPVAQTVNLTGDLERVGDLGAFVTASIDGAGFNKSFTEHCLLLGLVNVRADINYQQGLARMFSRQRRFDFYWPAFAHLGEQSVLNKEIFAQGSGSPGADDLTFGYQERYAEYRYKSSGTSGKMRSTAQTPLDAWHLALDFQTLPLLNDVFIQDAPPFSRIVATTTEPEFFGDFFFSYRCARPMPTYSVPGMVDHF